MKRYYISPIIGDGSADNPYRSAIDELLERKRLIGRCSVTMPPADPQTGRPLGTWCLVVLASQNHLNALFDSRLDALPDVPLDVATSAVGSAQRTAFEQALARRGISIGSLWGNEGWRSVIDRLGKKLDLNFSPDAFDVPDVT